MLKTDDLVPFTDDDRAALRAAGCLLAERPCPTEEELLRHAPQADALIVVREPVTASVIAALQRCRVVSRMGIGVDSVDVEAATAAGIAVCNVPEFCVEEVADHTIGLLLCLTRRLPALDAAARRGDWELERTAEGVHRLRGKVLGLLGFGRTARAVAERARAFGLRLLVHDPHVAESRIRASGARPVTLDLLLHGSDALSCHIPLLPETRHLIGRDELRRMKPEAVILNVSRGPVIDQTALVEALERGWIGGAGLDVFEQEPLAIDDPLTRIDRVLLSTHAAHHSEESGREVRAGAVQNVVRVLAGERPLACVNWEQLAERRPPG